MRLRDLGASSPTTSSTCATNAIAATSKTPCACRPPRSGHTKILHLTVWHHRDDRQRIRLAQAPSRITHCKGTGHVKTGRRKYRGHAYAGFGRQPRHRCMTSTCDDVAKHLLTARKEIVASSRAKRKCRSPRRLGGVAEFLEFLCYDNNNEVEVHQSRWRARHRPPRAADAVIGG